jgi:uncharacterized protein YwqG
MENVLDCELPEQLLAFKAAIEATVKPYIKIEAELANDLSLWQSKFGGLPYMPKDHPYPLSAYGEPLILLAQINFSETPALAGFPESGLLQFYIANGDDLYGACLDDLANQDGFRVVYFPEVLEDASLLLTDFSFLPELDMTPLEKSSALTFSLQSAPMTPADYQFETQVFSSEREDFYDLCEAYWELFRSDGHKLGGYPFFTQTDPRYEEKYKQGDYVLLLQMDSDDGADLMWGDCGVGNFFITRQDLAKKDFSKMLYTWDCS